ncbi:DNA/RNA non-specific endonuclease [Gracilimonas sp.]|uniref:DNA/RNA non-specific endonuclease n=1 Tax=Gracilimonas sp. TaxID=1974203 RepID=UPI0032F08F9E
MKQILGVLALWLISSSTVLGQYQEIHTKHFFKGYPAGTPESNDLIIRDLYSLSNNDETKFADWVAYRIDTLTMSGNDMPRNWKSDPWLHESETLEKDDYDDAHAILKTDRGHLAPLGSLDGNQNYFETNYLSNITPQKTNLNQGPWKVLERFERDIITTHKLSNYIIVYTGTLYEREMETMPRADESAKVPSGYWKIIIVPKADNQFDTAAFIFDQDTPRNVSPIDSLVTIDEIEERSGLDFFWELENIEENQLEAMSNSSWISPLLD